MPTYVFEHNGKAIERIAPIGTESITVEGVRWRRNPVSSFSATGFAKEEQLKDKVKRGYYKQECREGSRFASSFSKSEIRKAWRF